MIDFIVANGLDDDLRREDWRGFARGYNGAGYAQHGYHTKLKRAYEKWKRIPDTPFTPADIDPKKPNPNPPQEPVRATRGRFLKRGMQGPDVKILQELLQGLGYPVGAVDGTFGRLTAGAVKQFQSDYGLDADGLVGELTWEAFETARPTPLRVGDEKTLRERGSGTIKVADDTERKAKVTAASVGGLGVLEVGKDALETVSGSGGVLSEAQAILMDNWPVLAIMAVAAIVYFKGPKIMQTIRDIRVRDHVTGKHLGR